MLPLLPFMQADWWAARGRFQWSTSRSRSRRLRGDAVGGRRSATREGLPQDGATHRTSSSTNSTHDTSTNDTDRSLDGIYRPYCVASRIRRLPAPLDGRLGGRIACALRYLGDKARPLVNAHGLDRVRELTGRVAKIFMARSRRSSNILALGPHSRTDRDQCHRSSLWRPDCYSTLSPRAAGDTSVGSGPTSMDSWQKSAAR